jgi:hypothetical protein
MKLELFFTIMIGEESSTNCDISKHFLKQLYFYDCLPMELSNELWWFIYPQNAQILSDRAYSWCSTIVPLDLIRTGHHSFNKSSSQETAPIEDGLWRLWAKHKWSRRPFLRSPLRFSRSHRFVLQLSAQVDKISMIYIRITFRLSWQISFTMLRQVFLEILTACFKYHT